MKSYAPPHDIIESAMAPEIVYDRLTGLFPAFANYWNSAGACFRDDNGAFSLCGIFAVFSHFLREQYEQLHAPALRELGMFLAECMVVPDTALDVAAATCFLENLTGERFAGHFQTFLTDNALTFYANLRVHYDEV